MERGVPVGQHEAVEHLVGPHAQVVGRRGPATPKPAVEDPQGQIRPAVVHPVASRVVALARAGTPELPGGHLGLDVHGLVGGADVLLVFAVGLDLGGGLPRLGPPELADGEVVVVVDMPLHMQVVPEQAQRGDAAQDRLVLVSPGGADGTGRGPVGMQQEALVSPLGRPGEGISVDRPGDVRPGVAGGNQVAHLGEAEYGGGCGEGAHRGPGHLGEGLESVGCERPHDIGVLRDQGRDLRHPRQTVEMEAHLRVPVRIGRIDLRLEARDPEALDERIDGDDRLEDPVGPQRDGHLLQLRFGRIG